MAYFSNDPYSIVFGLGKKRYHKKDYRITPLYDKNDKVAGFILSIMEDLGREGVVPHAELSFSSFEEWDNFFSKMKETDEVVKKKIKNLTEN